MHLSPKRAQNGYNCNETMLFKYESSNSKIYGKLILRLAKAYNKDYPYLVFPSFCCEKLKMFSIKKCVEIVWSFSWGNLHKLRELTVLLFL